VEAVADKAAVDVVAVVRVAEHVNSMGVGLARKQRGSVRMKFKYTERDKPRRPDTGAGAILGKPDIKDFLTIRVAGNEQLPLDFSSDYVKSGRGPIKTFDYALEGDQDNFAIERKSLSDMISSVVLSDKWKHELAKIARAQQWLLAVIYIVEASFDDVAKYDYAIFKSGNVTSQFCYRRIATLIYDMNVHVVFAGSREGASYAIALLLKRRKEALKS